MKQKPQSQYGLTLIETILCIAIITGIILFSTRIFVSVRLNSKVTASIEQVKQTVEASYNWLEQQQQSNFQGNNQAININKLIRAHLLDKNANHGQWPGSSLTVTPNNGDNGHIRISLNDIPVSACINLTSRMKNNTLSQTSIHQCGKKGLTHYYGVF